MSPGATRPPIPWSAFFVDVARLRAESLMAERDLDWRRAELTQTHARLDALIEERAATNARLRELCPDDPKP